MRLPRGGDEGLRRHAAVVEAVAAHPVRLDQHHVGAEPGGGGGDRQAAGTGSYDTQVGLQHGFSPAPDAAGADGHGPPAPRRARSLLTTGGISAITPSAANAITSCGVSSADGSTERTQASSAPLARLARQSRAHV